MKNTLKTIALISTIAGLCLLSGCNTMEGVGKDMQEAGDELEEAAN